MVVCTRPWQQHIFLQLVLHIETVSFLATFRVCHKSLKLSDELRSQQMDAHQSPLKSVKLPALMLMLY